LGLPGRAFVTALVVCGGLVATAGNAMAGGWAFSNWGFWPREGSSPQVAMAPDGEAVVVDEHFEAIRAWRHTPEEDFAGGTFGEPVSPEESICCHRPEAPAVAIDPNGDIVVVWQEQIGSSAETGVYTSFRPRGGSFSPPTLVSQGTSPDVAIDADGEETASWLFNDGTSTVVEAAATRMGGPFSSPTRLSGDGGDASDVRVSVDPGGDAIVSWTRSTGTSTELEAAVRRAGGHFPPPDGQGDGAKLGEAEPTEPSEAPLQHIVMDSAGEALAVWEAPGGAVQEARLASGQSSFGAAATLGTTSAFPWVAMDEVGEAVVDWPIPGALDIATAPAGEGFGAPEQVVTEGTLDLAKVSMAPDGAVTLAGLKNTAEGHNGPGCKEISEYGSVRPPGGTFAKATGGTTACGPTGSATSLQVAGDSAGDTLAIWQESTMIGENVEGFVYDVGPSLSAVSIPTTAQVGQPVTFGMASPVSVWRPLIGVTWQLGDGTAASGLSVTHTYTQPGEYHVTASVADAQLLAPGFPERHIENSVTDTILVTPSPIAPSPKTATPLALPVITHVHESHRGWRERIPRKHRSGSPVGTTFTFTLNEQASLRFAFTRLPGKCGSHSNRSQRRACPRPVAVVSLSLAGHAGTDTLHFRGRLSSTNWLAPGNYSLTITATNDAGRSTATPLAFTIVG
jgi:PKD domain